jgi:NAD(P)-dependent dehydrogenase (short-subunit alcohol dehydrogenase family)
VGSLAGKVVVITGAAGGIGSATALVFARHGSKLFLVDRDEAGLTDSALAVEEAGAEVATHVADVTRSKDVQSYVAAALDRFGCIDAFFNNAGIEGAVAPIHEYPEDVFDQVIAVNLRGVFLGLRYVIPVMLKQGSGAIVNMGSIASAIGLPHSSAYIAAKHGVLGLTRSAASDVGRYGIRINAVMPGMIDTRMLRDLVLAISGDVEAGLAGAAAVAPEKRPGRPQEVGEVVAFLCSDEASFVNGVGYPIDGGALAVMANG